MCDRVIFLSCDYGASYQIDLSCVTRESESSFAQEPVGLLDRDAGELEDCFLSAFTPNRNVFDPLLG